MLWWGLGASALAIAALCIPAGAALAPETGEASSSSTFTTSTQLAERRLADPRVDELSGLAASRLHPGVLYGINDSGGGPTVYAIDESGATVAALSLDGATATDWEAIAPGWDADGTPVLWIGDIGNNDNKRSTVRLYKITEPASLADQPATWQSYDVAYSDGKHNAEALLVNPKDGAVSIATKSTGDDGALYSFAAPLSSSRTNTARPGMAVPAMITDGGWELSSTGDPRLVLIDYWSIHRRIPDGWTSALGPLQPQREALAWPWLPDGPSTSTVLLGSEGQGSQIIAAPVS